VITFLGKYAAASPMSAIVKFSTKKLKVNVDLCGVVVRVPDYRTEMYCVSCEVRTEFIYVV
jgi:hypothetical protein